MVLFGGTAARARIIILAGLLGALIAFPSFAHAATLFVTPSSGQYGVGKTFNVVVRVNSTGTAVNASEGVLSFNPAILQVQSISSTGSIFNLNVQEPEFSNSAGTVRWTGVILNPGYTGASGNLITVTFKGVTQGVAKVTYSSGAVLANDGAGTNVLAGLSGGEYTIGPTTVSPSPAAPAPTEDLTPHVTSTTHPDPLVWYSNNNPTFKWDLPSDVDGVSYIINPKSDANPGNASDGLKSSVDFTDVPEGQNFFHVKFRRAGVWGPITHFAFNVDTVIPDAFKLQRVDLTDSTNPRPLMTFSTNDSGSGIQKYMMKIDGGDWFEVDAAPDGSPVAIPLQPPGTKEVLVEAIDRAGNSTRASLVIDVAPITTPVIEEYPPQVPAGQGFDVSGHADPQVTVRLEAVPMSGRILFSDSVAASVEAKSDALGHWTATFPSMSSATYHIQAVAVDARGALSNPSNTVTVRVGLGWLQRFIDFLQGLFGTRLFGLLMLACMLWLAIFFWRMHGDYEEETVLPAGLKKREQQEKSKLVELRDDIEDELEILAKVSRHRPLYPEERYLKSKLAEYRKTVRFLLQDTHSRLAKRK